MPAPIEAMLLVDSVAGTVICTLGDTGCRGRGS